MSRLTDQSIIWSDADITYNYVNERTGHVIKLGNRKPNLRKIMGSLEGASVHFCSSQGFEATLRTENRRNRRYWYAVKCHKGKVSKVYLGVTSDLTWLTLQSAAYKLCFHLPGERGKARKRFKLWDAFIEHCRKVSFEDWAPDEGYAAMQAFMQAFTEHMRKLQGGW